MPLSIPGIEVSLRTGENSTEIPVYKPENINSGTVAGFVPSEAGQTFEVRVANSLVSGEGLVYTTYVDGREMYRFAVRPFSVCTMKGVYEANGVRPFTFSKLQLKEDDGQDPSFDLSKLGIIEVQVCRAIVRESLNAAPPKYSSSNVKASLDPVSEKAKKVGWHSVSLGAVKATHAVTSTRTDYIDPRTKPYAIFRFRYKPRELLEDEGIAPRTERPVEQPKQPSTGVKRPRPEEDANAGPSAKRKATENVKPEPTEGAIGGSQPKVPKVEGAKKVPKVEGTKKVKRERPAGEVIDLTNRGRSPIRVPVKGEVIDLSND